MYDGREMLRRVNSDLLESINSSFVSNYQGYQYINEAAVNWALRTNSLKQTQTITTVANDDTYTLAPDFLSIWPVNNKGKRTIQYNNGSSNYFPVWEDYEDIIHQSTRPSTSIPGNFAVIDNPTAGNLVSGTTTSAGVVSNGECTLNDTTASFSDTISVGDAVHNETDVDGNSNGSYGVVVAVTSGTALLVALFGGANADWTNGDSYIIVPQGRMQLVLDRPPITTGHTITVYYASRPTPVFSPFRSFRIQSHFVPAILREAKSLYEFRGGDYQTGQADISLSERKILAGNINYNKAFNRGKFGVRGRKGGH